MLFDKPRPIFFICFSHKIFTSFKAFTNDAMWSHKTVPLSFKEWLIALQHQDTNIITAELSLMSTLRVDTTKRVNNKIPKRE